MNTIFEWITVISPIIISSAVGVIGYHQFRINKHKFRLDLYNRRFAVYEKSLAYFQAYYSQNITPEKLSEISNDFIRAYRESIYLFGGNSKIYEELTKLKDTLNFYIDFDNRFKKDINRDHHPELYKTMSEQKDSMSSPAQIMLNIEKALLPWLDFRKIL